jgi:hypothetical protein
MTTRMFLPIPSGASVNGVTVSLSPFASIFTAFPAASDRKAKAAAVPGAAECRRAPKAANLLVGFASRFRIHVQVDPG